jgi:hypothetical protein
MNGSKIIQIRSLTKISNLTNLDLEFTFFRRDFPFSDNNKKMKINSGASNFVPLEFSRKGEIKLCNANSEISDENSFKIEKFINYQSNTVDLVVIKFIF